ncbi:restriction endonuclease subunit S [Enterococcus faecalis]|uniref:restriction endonuclease subunit S n=2 Tax=Enterococcus faecalis TaxID=1351 RepID=UPI0020910D97|nr:restriction endonuclease subunit S [Enterococcus faecalis]MCO5447625.1 restriction endonuclease subunit S [Enterococcus faecalis]
MENLFNYNWELCKFERIFEKVKSYSLSREVETNEFTGMKYIHYGDIHTKKADKVSENSNIPNIIKKNFALLEIGDLILTDASEDYKGIATPAVIRENTSFDIVAGLHTIALRPKNIDPMFLYYLIKAPTFRKYGYKVGTGMKVFGISSSKVLDFTTYIPKNDETKLVSSFLEKIDYALDLHQRKLDQLKELKKAYLQVMFVSMNTKNNKVPKLRFANFEGNWEQCKLIDLATTYIGLVTTMTTNYTDQGTLLIRNSDIKEGKFDLNNPIYLKEEFAKQNENRSMKMGDVVTVHTGDIGTSAVITEDLDGTIGFATITTRPSKKLNSNYLCWYFNSNIHKKYAKRMSTGDGRSNYNMKDFNKNILVIPKIEEQQTIGIFFQNLDNTITLHQNKLDQLKSLKKSYLQNMFI